MVEQNDGSETNRSPLDELAKLAPDIQAYVKNLDSAKVHSEAVSSDIDAVLISARERLQELQAQLEAAQRLSSEMAPLLTGAQTTIAQTAEANGQVSALLESLRSATAGATEAASRAEVLRTEIEQKAQVASTRSEHIEDGRKYVDAKRAEIDKILTQAQQSATNTEAQHLASKATGEALAAILGAAQTTKASIDSLGEAVKALRQQCEQHADTSKKLADIAVSTEQKVGQYELSLAELEANSIQRLATIDELLPGATSAGLASAFGKRRLQFMVPQRIWQVAFIGGLVGLLGVAVWEIDGLAKPDATLTFERLGLFLLHRLPFAIPLVWLAVYAARQAGLAKRLEEDYAFKEAVSRSFEGYRRQLAELESKAQPDSPLGRLCSDTLSIISQHPMRIYDKNRSDVSPVTLIAEATAEALAKINEAKGK